MPDQNQLVQKHRRHVRRLGYIEWVGFYIRSIYMRVYDYFFGYKDLPFGKNNLKIFCLNNGGEYLNVDRKMLIRGSPYFSDMLKDKPSTRYISIPVEYKTLRWCMRIVHGVDISWERPLLIRKIDAMFHLAHELQIDSVIDELLPDVVNENLLYLTWNYKHREATRDIYDKNSFHEIGKIMHSEKFRGKKYTVPALDFAALWDLKVKEEREEVEKIARGEKSTFDLPDSSRCGRCPFCALADLPYSIAPLFASSSP